jgi:tyrosine-protein phosphatase SIW14
VELFFYVCKFDQYLTIELVAAQRPPLKIARTLSTLSVNGLHPPENFAQVTKKVFRSSFPKPENLAYLKTLELKSIL